MLHPHRIGIVGLGMVATDRHIPCLIRNPNFTLTGVIDRHPGRATSVAKKRSLPYAAQTDSIDAVPWLDEIEALLICTPVQERAKLVRMALAQGKHVLTEKPFAMSLEEGKDLAACAERAGKTLAVVHNFLFSRGYRKLCHDLRTGRLGPMKYCTMAYQGQAAARTTKGLETLPLGAFYDDSPHHMYLLRDLAQGTLMLRNAESCPHPTMTTPRMIQLHYRDEANIPFSFQGHYESPIPAWFLCVAGQDALGLWDILRDIYIRLPAQNHHDALSMMKTTFSGVGNYLWGHAPNGLAFLRGRLDYGNDEVIDRFDTSLRTGRPDTHIGLPAALSVLQDQHSAIEKIRERHDL